MRPWGISKWWGRRAGTSATVVPTTVVFFLSFEYSWPLLLLCKGHQGGVFLSEIALFLLWGWPFLLPALSSPWPGPSIPPLLSAQRFLIRKSSLPRLTSCLKSHLHPCVSYFAWGLINSLEEGLAPSERSSLPLISFYLFYCPFSFWFNPCCTWRFPKSSVVQVPWLIHVAHSLLSCFIFPCFLLKPPPSHTDPSSGVPIDPSLPCPWHSGRLLSYLS